MGWSFIPLTIIYSTPHNKLRWLRGLFLTRLIDWQWCKVPVNTPPSGVLTPDALLTAVRVNEPVIGMELKKELKMLDTPRAIISCVASTVLPLAETQADCWEIARDKHIKSDEEAFFIISKPK